MSTPSIIVQRARPEDLPGVAAFLKPFIDQNCLLPRTEEELSKLLGVAFIATEASEEAFESPVIGFAALEIYSRKLGEIQCLAVSRNHRRTGIGRQLVHHCVTAAKESGVLELMAISNSEAMFASCGFHYSLPNQKRAFFISPQTTNNAEAVKDGNPQS